MIIRQIIIHHTVSSRDKTSLQAIDNWHRARWPNFRSSLGFWVGYHYVILGNGEIKQTRKDVEMGAHAIPNNGRLGIALCGNFEIERPSEAQLSSLTSLLKKLKLTYQLQDKDILGHHQVSATLCQGKNLIDWLENYKKQDLTELQKMIYEIQKKIELLKKALELLLKGRQK